MQKLPEASDRNRGDACAKKKDRFDKMRNLILFQQRPAECQHLDRSCQLLGDSSLANPSTGNNRLFHHQPMTKTPDFDELQKVTNTPQKLYIPNTLLKLLIPNKDTYIPKKRLTHF